MFRNYVIATVFTLFFTGCASTIEQRKKTDLLLTTEYTCDNKKKLEAVYLTTAENGHHARIQYKNNKYVLESVPSGSGAKYSDEKYTWWTKGSSGFLEIDNVIIMQDCVSQGNTDGIQ